MIPMLLIAFFIVVLDITGFKLDEDFSNIMYDMEDGKDDAKKSETSSNQNNVDTKNPVEDNTDSKVEEGKKSKEKIPNDADSLLEEIYGKGKK